MDLSDYDDTPYRNAREASVVYTISLDVNAVDGYRYVYVDTDEVRIARQRFDESVFDATSYTGSVIEWVRGILTALINDPDGRNACGGCGNYVLGGTPHAPDCRWSRWQQQLKN